MRKGSRFRRRTQLIAGQTKFVKLKYVDSDTPIIGAATATFGNNTYKLNSAFDVNASIGSANMPGFQEWAAFYQRYRVMAAKITCRYVIRAPNPTYIGIYFTPLAAPFSASWLNFRELEGNRNNVIRLCPASGVTGSVGKLKMFRTMKNLEGDKRLTYDDNYQALVTTNPSNIATGLVYCIDGNNVNNLGNIAAYVQVTVTMWIKFSNIKVLNS